VRLHATPVRSLTVRTDGSAPSACVVYLGPERRNDESRWSCSVLPCHCAHAASAPTQPTHSSFLRHLASTYPYTRTTHCATPRHLLLGRSDPCPNQMQQVLRIFSVVPGVCWFIGEVPNLFSCVAEARAYLLPLSPFGTQPTIARATPPCRRNSRSSTARAVDTLATCAATRASGFRR
jgi:hypothetical protein